MAAMVEGIVGFSHAVANVNSVTVQDDCWRLSRVPGAASDNYAAHYTALRYG